MDRQLHRFFGLQRLRLLAGAKEDGAEAAAEILKQPTPTLPSDHAVQTAHTRVFEHHVGGVRPAKEVALLRERNDDRGRSAAEHAEAGGL